jgi:two-component system sensor histidine kinase BaeS
MIRSIRTRLTLVFGGLTLLAVAVFALLVAGVLERLLIDVLTQDLEVQAHLVAGRVAADLMGGDRPAVQRILTELDTQMPARVLVIDTNRRLVGATEVEDRREIGRQSEQTGLSRALEGETVQTVLGRGATNESEVLYVATPVLADGRIVGATRLAYQLQDIKGTLDRLNLGIGLGAIGTAICSGLLALFFAASVSAPIQALSRATQALAAGDIEQRVAVRSKDEVGQLGTSFNDLAARLAELETAREEFAADISHELRALAGAMQTAITALTQGADQDPELKQALMDGLAGHADRLVRLADDLRELARIRDGWLTIKPEPVSLVAVARQAAAEWAAEAGRRNVRLDVGGDQTAIVNGDADRLVQACGNLIENAIKYASDGGWIKAEVHAGAKVHTLAVEDNGPGIPPAELLAIFRRSYRVEGRSGEGPGGMGLGLAIVDRIVRAHGGDATASNAPGHGATFSIRLPARREPVDEAPAT